MFLKPILEISLSNLEFEIMKLFVITKCRSRALCNARKRTQNTYREKEGACPGVSGWLVADCAASPVRYDLDGIAPYKS